MVLKLSSLKSGEIVLFVTSETKYAKTNLEILKHYVNKEKKYCAYITVNRPYTRLIEDFKENKLDTSRLLVIDAITPIGSNTQRAGNAVFIGSPRALTQISLVLTNALKKIPDGKKVLFLDSITTLSVYNDLGSVSKFSEFLVSKMREWNVSGAIISLEKEKSDKISSYLSQIVDKVIEVK
jgi:KaiC/GvpD/RAD55 family RecA-like ATPase